MCKRSAFQFQNENKYAYLKLSQIFFMYQYNGISLKMMAPRSRYLILIFNKRIIFNFNQIDSNIYFCVPSLYTIY